jgi:hypothetical protein
LNVRYSSHISARMERPCGKGGGLRLSPCGSGGGGTVKRTGLSGLDGLRMDGLDRGTGREGKGEDRKSAGGPEGLPRALPFPIARPAALAFSIRLPLVPERKPVIVPTLGLSLAPSRAAGRSLSGVCRHCA